MAVSQSKSTTMDTDRKEVTVVEVRNHIIHNERLGRAYTDYEICIKSTSKAFTIPQSFVRRRYSEFVWLRNWLGKHNEGFSSIRKIPKLPPKKIVNRFDTDFLEDRMKGLQKFLRRVIEHNVFLSDKALHLFLQSGMSVKQIESYLTGKSLEPHTKLPSLFDAKYEENNTPELSLHKIMEISGSSTSIECASSSSSSDSLTSSSINSSFETVNIEDCINDYSSEDSTVSIEVEGLQEIDENNKENPLH